MNSRNTFKTKKYISKWNMQINENQGHIIKNLYKKINL